jgi:enamine deaminase RidA (YjgF/YER057c/UK114 family)
LNATGSSWEKVVKVNVYLKNMDDFAAMNEVYEKVYRRSCTPGMVQSFTSQQLLPNPKPARTCIQAGKLPNDVDVEMEAIATT